MASETIYGYFGQKGAGKTHELVRVICDRLREGRYVVAVMPQLNVDRVADYLGDPTVKDRLVVCDYTEVENNPKFWPDESVVQALQLWNREDPIPPEAYRWRESVVIPGALVVIDEVWRWMRSVKELEKARGFKEALRMARHWHGPIDWRNPDDIAKFTSPDWFPPLGGPEWGERFVANDEGVVVPERYYRGGDGTPLVTTNILVATQSFFGLAAAVRDQIDQTTQLVSIRDDYFPSLLKKATDGLEQYKAYTFEAADMPTRRQMLGAMEKGESLWLTEQTITHSDAIHSLYEYSSGHATQKRADDKSDLKHNPHWKKIKRQGWMLGIALLFAIGLAVFAIMKLPSSDTFVSESSGKKVINPGGNPTKPGAASSASSSGPPQMPPAPPGFAGRIGKMVMVDQGGRYAWFNADDLERGPRGSLTAVVGETRVNSETSLAGADRGAGRPRDGVGGDAPAQGPQRPDGNPIPTTVSASYTTGKAGVPPVR